MNPRELSPGLNPWFWAAFLVGIVSVSFPYLGYNLAYLPGDLGDTRFNIFILEHAKQFFGREVKGFWSAGFMYPEAEVITYSDNFLGTAPVFALFRWLGADIFTSFQLWILALAFLNYWAAFKLAEYLLEDKKTAAIAAFVFAFSLSLASQMNHAQTFPRFALPLSLLFLLRWIRHTHTIDFAAMVTLLVYQFYCGIYLGFLTALPFAVILASGLWPRRQAIISRLKSWPTLAAYTGTVVINAWLMLKLFLPYLRRAGHGGLYSYEEISHSIPTPLSYLSAHPSSILYPSTHRLVDGYTAFWDHWIFPGWLALAGFLVVTVLLAKSVLKEKSSRATPFTNSQTLFFAAGAVLFFIYLRFDQQSFYYFLQKVPGFGAMRALARIINIELLFIGVSLAWVMQQIMHRVNSRPAVKNMLLALCMALLIIENQSHPTKIVRTEKAQMQNRQEALVAKMKHLPAGSIISYEPDTIQSHVIHYQIDAMLAAQSLHLRSVNGYSATSAYMFDRYWLNPNTENRLFWFSRFDDLPDTDIHIIK